MQHFKAEIRGLGGDILTAYPHSPEDAVASMGEYLEDMLSQGYEFIETNTILGSHTFFFRVVAK